MLTLIGFLDGLLTSCSGRAMIVTRMAASGALNKIRILITRHLSFGGYDGYDKTRSLNGE